MSSAESSVSSDSDSSDEERTPLATGPVLEPAGVARSAPANASAPVQVPLPVPGSVPVPIPVPVPAPVTAAKPNDAASGGGGTSSPHVGTDSLAPGVGGAVQMEPKGRPQGLVFDSNFESGNLAQVVAVDGAQNEYELFIRPDTHNDKYRLWFYFSVRPTPCLTQRRVLFHIVNFSKSKSLSAPASSPVS